MVVKEVDSAIDAVFPRTEEDDNELIGPLCHSRTLGLHLLYQLNKRQTM